MKPEPLKVETKEDPPLPGTLLFVLTMGAAFLVGWLILFLLMKDRY